MASTKREQTLENDKESMDKLSEPVSTPLLDSCTSIESSGIFDTWTLVSDRQKLTDSLIVKDNDESRVEILNNSQFDTFDVHERKFEQHRMQESLNDDDDISIISETESFARISPNPCVCDHLYDLNIRCCATTDDMNDEMRQETPIVNFKFSTTDNTNDEMTRETAIVSPQDPAEQAQLLRSRRSSNTKAQTVQNAFQTMELLLDVPFIGKRGVLAIFNVIVGLVILTIIGLIGNLIWQRLAGVDQILTTSAQLQQKVNNMELQNNLMRARIELLNEKINNHKQHSPPHSHGTFEKFQDSLKEGFENLKENFVKFSDSPKETLEKYATQFKETVLSKSNQDNLKAGFANLKENFIKYSDYSKGAFEKMASEFKEKIPEKLRFRKKGTLEKIQDNLKEGLGNLKKLFF